MDLGEFLAARIGEEKDSLDWHERDCQTLRPVPPGAPPLPRVLSCDCGVPGRIVREAEFHHWLLGYCQELYDTGFEPMMQTARIMRRRHAAIWPDHPDYDSSWAPQH